jgi:uncharacterized tellurite resistance protein B-like protein
MINSIKNFFESKLIKANGAEQGSELVQKVDLASAALLIEVMNSDHELDERESNEFLSVLKSTLNVNEEDIDEIIELAKEEARKATSLYEFTRLINESFDYSQKLTLMENMWRIAFSDEKLDRYEDHLIRKVSDLIYVSHSDFIKAKLKVRG